MYRKQNHDKFHPMGLLNIWLGLENDEWQKLLFTIIARLKILVVHREIKSFCISQNFNSHSRYLN